MWIPNDPFKSNFNSTRMNNKNIPSFFLQLTDKKISNKFLSNVVFCIYIDCNWRYYTLCKNEKFILFCIRSLKQNNKITLWTKNRVYFPPRLSNQCQVKLQLTILITTSCLLLWRHSEKKTIYGTVSRFIVSELCYGVEVLKYLLIVQI